MVLLLTLALAIFITPSDLSADNRPPPTIAIIIDDLGNHEALGDRLINIPAPLTLAFLPLRKHTKMQANKAFHSGKEIMLHAPMENTRNIPLGAAGLKSHMSTTELLSIFRRALRSVPYISGVNNHMGSVLTQNRRAMNALMNELRAYPLYFVDSRTTASSLAQSTAIRYQIPALGRDIFLDNNVKTINIHKQFRKLVMMAKERGTAIGIGHPHLKTVSYLERMLPRLGKEGVAVATISGIWSIRHSGELMFSKKREANNPLLAQSEETRSNPVN